MINVGTLSKLGRMVRTDGLSVREASKRLGIARNTPARWLSIDEMVEPKYPKRVTVESILDPYKEQLINWIKTVAHAEALLKAATSEQRADVKPGEGEKKTVPNEQIEKLEKR